MKKQIPRILRNLQDTFPDIAAQWHPSKNEGLLPNKIASGSSKRVWWKCQEGIDHEWQTAVCNRTGLGTGCPYCSNKMIGKDNNLAVLQPALSRQWHPEKNGELSPTDVGIGSNKKVWWKCLNGDDHEWQAIINSRAKSAMGCPFCAGKQISKSNNLAALKPDVAAKWHPTKNGNLGPDQVTCGSPRKIWWECPVKNGHVWQATVARMVKSPSCPYCINRKIGEGNSLAALYPDLSSQWHPTKNGDLKPTDIGDGSGKAVWWKCPNSDDHIWRSRIDHRARRKIGCPFCSNQKLSQNNSLEALMPELAKEWHTTKNGNLLPKDVVFGASRAVWWKCPQGKEHEWKTSVSMRTGQNTGCPFCSNHKVSSDNNFAVKFPEIAKEWHPTKNVDVRPEDVVFKSDKKVWWQCSRHPEHEWRVRVADRANGNGCPKCTDKSSEPEIRILTEMIHLFGKVESRARIDGVEVDIYITDLKIGIEYDGAYWHRDKVAKDRAKQEKLTGSGVNLLRIREYPLKPIGRWDMVIDTRNLNKSDLNGIVEQVISMTDYSRTKEVSAYLAKESFQGEKLFRKFLSYFPDPFPEKSLESIDPSLAREWDFEANFPLTPRNFTAGSGKKVWWRCVIDNRHKWQAVIISRLQGTGCPYCASGGPRKKFNAGNSLDATRPKVTKLWHPTKNENLKPAEVGPGSNRRVWWQCPNSDGHVWQCVIAKASGDCPFCEGKRLCDDNHLAATHPRLAIEWHPIKNNELRPNDVLARSGQFVWWKCPKGEDHQWRARINYRAVNGVGCPFCSGLKASETNSLEARFPEIASQWHPTKNSSLLPNQVSYGSEKKVWWQCIKADDHIWQTTVNARTHRRAGCPFCSGRKASSSTSLSAHTPELAKQWHPTKNSNLSPDEVKMGSGKVVWWRCSVDPSHEWKAQIYNRAKRGQGCPYCKLPKSNI